MIIRLNRRTMLAWLLLVPVVLSLSLYWAAAQPQMGSRAKGVQQPIYDSQNRLTTLLSFGEVQPKGNQLVEIKGLKVELFDYVNGKKQTNLTVLATNCLYDKKLEVATSEQAVQAVTGDGRIKLSGVGFKFEQADSKITVSNQVRIEIDREIIVKKEGK